MLSRTVTVKCVVSTLFAALLLISGLPAAKAQGTGTAVTISGKVLDSAGGALPGAGILIKGTTRGTTSDIDGKYSLNAKVGDVLVYSFTGMVSKEETVGKAAVINVTLEDDALLLGEAISIGYGKQSRALLTNSITKVSAEEFEHSPQQNALA